MTKLATAMSAYDAAKAVGVVARTVDRYHVAMRDEVTDRAADALVQVQVHWQCPSHHIPPPAGVQEDKTNAFTGAGAGSTKHSYG